MMGTVKKIIQFSMELLFLLSAVSMLLQQFQTYEKAYTTLSVRISHPSILETGENGQRRK